MAIATINPATGEVLKTFDPMSRRRRSRRRSAGRRTAFLALRRTTFAERAGWMRAAADLLDAERDDDRPDDDDRDGQDARGGQGRGDQVRHGAAASTPSTPRRYLADEPADAAAVRRTRAYARYQPLGPVLAVMPWNFPLWQVMRFAAPALMAGNTGLLKHASNVPQTALYLEDLFRRAGFPDGAFQTLLIGSDAVEAVLSDPRVRAATLTGSEGAGRSVAAIAGRELKKTVLELGGSDPFVVMPSADLDAGRRRWPPPPAARTTASPASRRSGSSCTPTSTTSSRRRSWRAMAACGRRPDGRRAPTSGRSPPSRAATTSRSWSPTRSTRAPRCSCGGERAGPARLVLPADRGRRHHAGDADVRPRRSSARSPGSTGSRRSTRRSSSPTRPTSGWAPTPGPPTPAEQERVRHRPRRRPGLRQRHGHLVPAAAVRRREALRLRARAVRPRHPRVLQPQDRLGGVIFLARVRGGRDRCSRAQTVGPSRPCPAGSAFTRPTSALHALGASAMIAEKYLQREFWGC